MTNARKVIFHPAVLIPILLLGFIGAAALAKVAIWPKVKKIQASKLKEEAKDLVELGNYSNAFIEIRKSILKNPKDLESYKIALSIVENSTEHYQYIPGFLQQLMQLEPDNSEHFNKYILLSLRIEQIEEAQKAFENYPDGAKTSKEYHQIGYSIGVGTDDLELADYHLEKLLEMHPGDDELLYRLSTLRLQASNDADKIFGAKVALSNLADQDNSRLPALRVLLAHSLVENETHKTKELVDELAKLNSEYIQDQLLLIQARRTFDSNSFNDDIRRLLSNPIEDPTEIVLILDFLMKNGLIEEAELWLESLDEDRKDNDTVRRKISQIYYLTENWPKLKSSILDEDWKEYEFGRFLLLALISKVQSDPLAFRKYWQQCLIQVGNNRNYLKSLFQTIVEWGWEDESIEVLERSFHVDPADDEIFTVIVNHFMKVGETSRALEILERRVEYVPDDLGSKNNFALLSALTNTNQSKAFTYAKENYVADPENPYFITTWAFVLHRQKRFQEAVELVESLPNEEKMDPQRGLYIAKIYLGQGDLESAKNYLNGLDEEMLFAEEIMLLSSLQESIQSAKE